MKGNALTLGCFLLGIAVGLSGLSPEWLLDAALRMLLLPLFTIAGSLLFSAAAALLPGNRPLAECLAVGSGFGYYSLSSVLIADVGAASLGEGGAAELATVALLANVVREMFALFCLSLFARWCGRVAPISAAGINSMDVCLPGIVRYSGGSTQLVPLAVLHGIALEVSVPLLIGFFCRF